MFSSSYMLYHEIICLRLLLDIYSLPDLSFFSSYMNISLHIIDHMFLLVFGIQSVKKHEMFPPMEEKQSPLRQINLPEQRKDALLWNSTESWNQSTQEVIYQYSLKVTISNSENHPREGFRISKCFWDCSRKQFRGKHHL